MNCCQPIWLTDKKTGGGMQVPCGTCPSCRDRVVAHWSHRLRERLRVAHSAQFLTLTYSDKNLVYTWSDLPSLDKSAIPLFMKRLRKAHGAEYAGRISYFACGEYGTFTERPHYHMLLFDADITKIQDAWNLGHIHYGQVTEASIAYTCKYICKESIVKRDHQDRLPEFRLMSKNLGLTFLTDEMRSYMLNDIDRLSYIVEKGGKKVSMPRYYKSKVLQVLAERIGEDDAKEYGLEVGRRALARIKKVEAMERERLGDDEFNRLKSEQYKLIYRKFFNQKKRKI